MAPRHNRRGRTAADQQAEANGGGQPAILGPRSALTSFLHEQGITGPNAAPNYHRGSRQQPQQAQQAAPGTPASTATTVTTTANASPASSSSAPSTPANTGTTTAITGMTMANQANAVAGPSNSIATTSPHFTVEVQVSSSSPAAAGSSSAAKKRKPSAAATAAALKKKKKQEAEEGDGMFNLAGKSEGTSAPKKGKYDNRTPGAIAVCGECGKKFTVTKYTASNPNGPGMLCSPCTNESIEDIAKGAFKTPVDKKQQKRKAVKSVEERMYRPITTLQQCCIGVIGKHIDNVDAFGDIGPANLDRVAQIVCKNRALTGDNMHLFLETGHTELTLYDCTSIRDHELANLATFCPRLERLTLNMCGRLDDDVLEAWKEGFKNLRYLSLYAPYLVTAGKWKEYFETFGGDHQLEGFGLRQSARFDDAALAVLVERNPGLFNLQLSEIGKLSDDSLKLLHPLKQLTTLDISRAGVNQGNVLTDDAVVALLEQVGENLVELVLDQNYLLTDRVLLEGVKIHCPRLERLSLYGLDQIQSTGLQSLFTDWVNPGLTHLVLHRVLELENEAILALAGHSGHSLESLDLHSVDEIDEQALMQLAQSCPRMKELDLSFVRATDNFVVKACLDNMPELKKLFVHGNNRVTMDCPQKHGVSIRGLENMAACEL